MARYQAEHKRETRRRILEAADDVIKAQGVEAASVAEVMRRAGLTVGGFYAHFPSKEALAQEALLFGLEPQRRPHAGVARRRLPTPRPGSRALISQYLAQAEDPDSTACLPDDAAAPGPRPRRPRHPQCLRGAYRRAARPDRRALSRDRRHVPPPGRARRVHELRRRGRRSPAPSPRPKPVNASWRTHRADARSARSVLACEIIGFRPASVPPTAFAEWTIPMLDSTVHAQLAAILPPAALLVARKRPSRTNATASRCIARGRRRSLLPENEAQVVAILKACHAARVPVVARGAGTSLSGGALPDPAGVVLSLAKFKRIVADRSARAHRGRAAGRAQSRDLRGRRRRTASTTRPIRRRRSRARSAATSPRTRAACIASSTASPCTTCAACAACSITGEVVEFGGEALDSAGYDLLALITGSEGLLAVITEITVKLLPKPQLAQVALAAFDDVEKAGAAVGAIIGAGIIPAGPRDDGPGRRRARSSNSCTPTIRSTRPRCCSSNPTARTEEVAAEMAEIRRVLTQSGATEIRVSARRGAAPPVLVRAQGGVSRGRPHLARLLLHRRHDPAQGAAARAARDRRVVAGVRTCPARTCSTPATATCIR